MAMSARRERIEISIRGGRPWGFSVKGGVESNKPLTISKLEKGGKAESAGLFVGDVLHSVNNVLLTGSRNEAVQLVKMSESTLAVEVERGSLPSRARPFSGSFTRRLAPAPEGDYVYCESHSRPSSQILEDDQFETRTESGFSRTSYSPSSLSASSSSINERILSPQDGARFEALSCNASEHLRNSNSDIREQMRSLDQKTVGHSDLVQPPVRLRSKKARDRGFPTERPRSWHASKHTDPGYLGEETTMRSPGSGYLAAPTQAPRYHSQHPHPAPRRRSKGWCESGDLKSTIRPEVNGSRDSVISADSHRSYRSGRLSVSSSRSSGTMSSSRGSLDNLLDNNSPALRPNLESHPQPVVLSSKPKHPPSPHPQSGIVSQKMNLFERLSQDTSSNVDSSRGSREDLDRIHRLRQNTAEIAESDKRHRENTGSPPQQSHYCLSPPPASRSSGKQSSRKMSLEEHVTKQDNNQTMRVSPPVTSGVTFSDAKIVKTTSFDPYRNPQQNVPAPPQRDESSAMAVKSHIRPNLQNENNCHISKSPPSAYSRSPPYGKPTHHHSASTSYLEPTHRIVTRPIEKTIEGNTGHQERMFGVMATGTGGSIVATSVTVSPKVSVDMEARKTIPPDVKEPVSRYQNVKDFSQFEADAKKMVSDYLSRAEMKAEEKISSHKPDHAKSHSDDATELKTKGKYGSVWKTPQNQHSRARSENFSNVLRDWTDRETDNSKAITDNKESEMNRLNKKFSDTTSPPVQRTEKICSRHSPTEDAPSVLKSLQNTQQSEIYLPKPDGKGDNYEKLWLSESKLPAKTKLTKSNSNADYKDWRSEYQDDDDEPVDDPFSPSDRYADNIKGISEKVLRETSFKRSGMDVSPSVQSFSQKKKQFQYPEQNKQSGNVHPRSRSYGNELDEESQKASVGNVRRPQSNKPRPKSAGVFRARTDRNAPAARNLAAPSQRPKIDHRKSDSLPDDGSTSLGYDDLARLASSNKTAQNRRVSIDVKPDAYGASGTKMNETKSNRRSEVIDFFTRKAQNSLDSSIPGHYTSMININTASFDDVNEKHKNDRIITSSDDRSKKLRSPPSHVNGGRVKYLIENETPKTHYSKVEHGGSVRKLKNFKETREKFLKGFDASLSRAKSTSSLLDDDSPKNGGLSQSSSSIKSGDRSASLENLLDCRPDNPVAPPRNGMHPQDELRHPSLDQRSKSSPLITPLSGKGNCVVPPPRKHPKNHRQRISNSSSASSATTISTMSSFSSGSSTSIGIFPTVGEEKSPKRLSPPQETSPSPESVPSSSELSSQSVTENRSGPRIPIDTNTYRVPKRKSSGKLLLKSRQSAENLPKTEADQKTENERFSTPPESLISNPPLDGAISRQDSLHSKLLIAPPPPPPPLDDAAEKLLEQLIERRKSQNFPPPPGVPYKSTSFNRGQIREESQENSLEQRKLSAPNKHPELDNRNSSGRKYENVHMKENNLQYENVFDANSKSSPVPDHISKDQPPTTKQTTNDSEAAEEKKETPPPRTPITISSEPLLPDVSFLPESTSAATLEEEHPDLTRDIIKGDKALAQVLTTNSKKAIDYMTGVLPQPSHHIVEEGMKYRRRKPGGQTPEKQPEVQFESLLPNDITSRDNLPASSTYYKTSASKAKILSLMKEKLADGEIPDEEQETLDEINHKKVELVLSIKKKLDDLQSMRGLLEVEMRENESLGKQVFNLTKSMCTAKEQDKYNILVQEVDKIINLLLSLSGRLARVENTIQMMPSDADKQEMEILCEKRKKLTEQHNDAKQLKESIDKRQKTVSEILAGYFDQDQFADYEHYIKMKSALIMEQRELDDKTKLGQEQMQCLRDSLPEEWQNNLDQLLEE